MNVKYVLSEWQFRSQTGEQMVNYIFLSRLMKFLFYFYFLCEKDQNISGVSPQFLVNEFWFNWTS